MPFGGYNQAAVAVLLGSILLDILFGEPPESLHPVVWIGRAIDRARKKFAGGNMKKLAGACSALVVVATTAALTYFTLEFADGLWKSAGLVLGSFFLKTTFSIKSLLKIYTKASEMIESNTERAKEELAALVGRDRSELSKAEMRSAALESLFENLVDSLISPLFYFGLGSFVSVQFGVTSALAFKAVNTLDSMIGYKTGNLAEFGLVSARIDDLLNWIPSRLSILFVGLAACSWRAVVVAWRDWSETPSPNSGWSMGAAAGAIEVRLLKPECYTLGREYELPQPEDLNQAKVLAQKTVILLLLVIGAFITFV